MPIRIISAGPFSDSQLVVSFSPKFWRAPESSRRQVIQAVEQWSRDHPDSLLYDGDNLRLISSEERANRLHFHLQPSGFYDYLATNYQLPAATSRLESANQRRESRPLANLLSAEVAVLTADRQLIFSRRADNLPIAPGVWQNATGENIEINKDLDQHGQPNLFSPAYRGLSEELGISRELIADLQLLALIDDAHLSGPKLLFVAAIRLDSKTMLARANGKTAIDSWEHQEYCCVDLDRPGPEVDKIGIDNCPWSPSALSALLLIVEQFKARSLVDWQRALEPKLERELFPATNQHPGLVISN